MFHWHVMSFECRNMNIPGIAKITCLKMVKMVFKPLVLPIDVNPNFPKYARELFY